MIFDHNKIHINLYESSVSAKMTPKIILMWKLISHKKHHCYFIQSGSHTHKSLDMTSVKIDTLPLCLPKVFFHTCMAIF